MNIPEDLQYTDEHEWLRLDGESAFVGVTDHMQAQLGSLMAVRLPDPGTSLICGQVAATIQSETGTHVIKSPLSGMVTSVNSLLTSQPGVINASPYEDGWLFELRMEAGEEIEHLRDPKTYRNQLGQLEEAES